MERSITKELRDLLRVRQSTTFRQLPIRTALSLVEAEPRAAPYRRFLPVPARFVIHFVIQVVPRGYPRLPSIYELEPALVCGSATLHLSPGHEPIRCTTVHMLEPPCARPVPLNMASGRRDPKPQGVLRIAVGVSCDCQREIRPSGRSMPYRQPSSLVDQEPCRKSMEAAASEPFGLTQRFRCVIAAPEASGFSTEQRKRPGQPHHTSAAPGRVCQQDQFCRNVCSRSLL
jgi:hypothetical protein